MTKRFEALSFPILSFPILGVVILLAFVLVSTAGASSAPLGVVVAADNPRSGVDTTYTGATIYDGDHLSTRELGAMRLRLGTGQLVLHQNTSVVVHALPNGFSAGLDNGTVSASSLEGQTFQLLVDGVTIRPATSQPTSAQISWVTPKEAILTSSRGDLQVSLDGDVQTVKAGNSYRLEIDPEAAAAGPDPQGPPIAAGKNRHVLMIIIITAVAVGTGIAIWRATVSPTAPQ